MGAKYDYVARIIAYRVALWYGKYFDTLMVVTIERDRSIKILEARSV